MEKLIDEVSEKAGISRDQAQIAIRHVSGSLKARLPYFFHRQLDHLLAGGTLSEGVKLKFNEMKGDVEEAARGFGKRAGEFADDVKRKMDDTFK